MDDSTLPFQVVRRPNFPALMRLVRAADVVHLAGPCFLPMLLGLLFRKQIVVEHHGFQVICPNGQLFYEPTQMPCPGHFMAGRHRQCLRCNARAGTVASLKMWLLTFARRWLAHYAAVNVTPPRASRARGLQPAGAGSISSAMSPAGTTRTVREERSAVRISSVHSPPSGSTLKLLSSRPLTRRPRASTLPHRRAAANGLPRDGETSWT